MLKTQKDLNQLASTINMCDSWIGKKEIAQQ